MYVSFDVVDSPCPYPPAPSTDDDAADINPTTLLPLLMNMIIIIIIIIVIIYIPSPSSGDLEINTSEWIARDPRHHVEEDTAKLPFTYERSFSYRSTNNRHTIYILAHTH